MVITATTANSSLHQLQTFNSQNNNNNNHLRDASFSSYLNNKEENFGISNRKDPLDQGAKKEEDGEIGVFGAEKYFNGGEIGTPRVNSMDAKKYQYQKEEQTALETSRKCKVQYGTPSVRSESSLNSQSALLQSAIMRNSSSSRKGKNQAQRKGFLASLGCKCSCSDKNSVDVSDYDAGEISFNKAASTYGVAREKSKTTSSKKLFNATDLDAANHSVKITKPHAETLINKDVYFQKPEKLEVGLNKENGLANQLVKMQLQQVEKPRKSLEVFGSPILDGRGKSLSFDKRLNLTIPSWEAAPKNMEEEIDYDDAGSDASSDLFEIESFTGKSNSFLGGRTTTTTTSNVASGCASPTCYAPSEASIEWSVVTASAVEYSAMSDCEDQGSVATIRSPIRTSSLTSPSNGKQKVSREILRRRPGKLLGCNSQKAVGVASNAFTTTCEKPSSSPQIHRMSDIFPRVTRFQVETKEENFGARHGQQHAYAATPPLRTSHSPHAASQLLYI